MGAHGSRELRDLLDSVRRIVQVLRESAAATERETGLTAAQLFVLERLAGQPPLSLSELAARTFTHQSSASVVVSRLVERRLVQRKAAADDARRAEVSLTAAGRRALADAPEAAQNRLVRALERLSPAKRVALGRSLDHLVEAMEIGGQPARMFFEEPGPKRTQPPRRKAKPRR